MPRTDSRVFVHFALWIRTGLVELPLTCCFAAAGGGACRTFRRDRVANWRSGCFCRAYTVRVGVRAARRICLSRVAMVRLRRVACATSMRSNGSRFPRAVARRRSCQLSRSRVPRPSLMMSDHADNKGSASRRPRRVLMASSHAEAVDTQSVQLLRESTSRAAGDTFSGVEPATTARGCRAPRRGALTRLTECWSRVALPRSKFRFWQRIVEVVGNSHVR